MSDLDPLPCPRCGELPDVAQDDYGRWDASHIGNWFTCGTPMALNYGTKRDCVMAWNDIMIRRKANSGN